MGTKSFPALLVFFREGITDIVLHLVHETLGNRQGVVVAVAALL